MFIGNDQAYADENFNTWGSTESGRADQREKSTQGLLLRACYLGLVTQGL